MFRGLPENSEDVLITCSSERLLVEPACSFPKAESASGCSTQKSVRVGIKSTHIVGGEDLKIIFSLVLEQQICDILTRIIFFLLGQVRIE